MSELLSGKPVLITDAARRLGQLFAFAYAGEAQIAINHSSLDQEVESVRPELTSFG